MSDAHGQHGRYRLFEDACGLAPHQFLRDRRPHRLFDGHAVLGGAAEDVAVGNELARVPSAAVHEVRRVALHLPPHFCSHSPRELLGVEDLEGERTACCPYDAFEGATAARANLPLFDGAANDVCGDGRLLGDGSDHAAMDGDGYAIDRAGERLVRFACAEGAELVSEAADFVITKGDFYVHGTAALFVRKAISGFV